MEEELRASLLSAIGRMTETLGRAEGSARKGDLNEAMVFLAALEKDAGGVQRPWPTLWGPSTTSGRRDARSGRPTGTGSRSDPCASGRGALWRPRLFRGARMTLGGDWQKGRHR